MTQKSLAWYNIEARHLIHGKGLGFRCCRKISGPECWPRSFLMRTADSEADRLECKIENIKNRETNRQCHTLRKTREIALFSSWCHVSRHSLLTRVLKRHVGFLRDFLSLCLFLQVSGSTSQEISTTNGSSVVFSLFFFPVQGTLSPCSIHWTCNRLESPCRLNLAHLSLSLSRRSQPLYSWRIPSARRRAKTLEDFSDAWWKGRRYLPDLGILYESRGTGIFCLSTGIRIAELNQTIS